MGILDDFAHIYLISCIGLDVSSIIDEYEQYYLHLTKNIENAAREINNSFLPQIIAFYLINKKQPDSPRGIANYLNRLLYKKYRDSQLYYVSYLKYKNGLLILYSFDRKQKIDNEQLICQKLLQNYDMAADEFYIGISMAKEIFVSLPMVIQESIDACHICQQQEKNYLYYKELGIYRTLLPLNNNTAVQHISAIIQALKKYDDKYTSNLQETLLCYVRCNGEISKTTAELFQHPNTIRYRLQKAKKFYGHF